MLDSPDILLLVGVAVILLTSFVFLRRQISYHAAKAQKYRLFAVRDRLIYLVATGKIDSGSWLFRLLYASVTFYLGNLGEINLANFVRTISEARSAGKDPAEQELARRVSREIRECDDEVRAVFHEFYDAVTEILIRNSLLLRIAIRCTPLVRLLSRIRHWFDSGNGFGGATPLQAYRLNQDYQAAAALIAP